MSVIGYYQGGWTCSCGAWVPNGITHTCYTNIPQYTYVWPNEETQRRIADALERIAKALEEG